MLRALIVSPPDPLFSQVFGPAQIGALEERLAFVHPPVTPERLCAEPALLREVDILFTTWNMPRLDAVFLDEATDLKAVFYCAGSIRPVKTDAAYDRGIRFFSAWGANAIPVAEFTFAQIILSLKSFFTRAVVAEKTVIPSSLGRDFVPAGGYGSTVGLISMGQIGRLVAKHLQSMQIQVLAYDPYVKANDAKSFGVEVVGLEELFERSNVVSCHAPWLPETEGLLNASLFARMKPGATFINTARGAVVDEVGMIEVLARRPDLTALLDVTHPEPPAADSPLRSLPNVLRTPHIAGAMGNERRRLTDYMIEEFDRYERGEAPDWEVTRERADLLA
jgi:phosphoglycerate dehydrogenase-like enzyme